MKSSRLGFAPRRALGYALVSMGEFFSSLFSELAARRRRMRELLGDRPQAICEFLVMAGLLVGSLGLFFAPWMAAAAPWGFGLPFLFAIGFLLIEARRQGELRRGAEAEPVAGRYDWFALLWSFACALAGAAAFVIAWSARPAPPEPLEWTPPESAVAADIVP